MIQVLTSVWALLIGIVLIMLGNGMHFTLIGLRGGIEGFSSAELAIVTSGYFAGFLAGARLTPRMIRRVGHVRVFAALGSFTSAALIALPLIPEPWAWTLLRVILGFCMSGIYVTAESWLNDSSTNETRGKVLSAYMIAQTLGIIGAQGLLTFGDAANSALFIVASILVSISFAPILLSASSVPMTEAARPMGLKELFAGSPLSTVGIFLLGCVYATQTGMAAVFGTQIDMTTGQIAAFVAMLFAGALVFQYPIGWLSDRMDRRTLIFGASMVAMGASMLGGVSGDNFVFLMGAAFLAGGMTTPLYALFLAYTNDYLPLEDMPAASGGLVLTFGVGAILGPLLAGWSMEHFGPRSFWLVLAVTFAVIAVYALYRMTRRESLPVEETERYVSVLPTTSPMAVETAGVWAAEQAEAGAEAASEEAAAKETGKESRAE
ncbi:major facilitator transporter [Thalassospira profundimaris]|uniref:Major facilitator transporter n=1 Tax=Thalassospira profundimaris TaxID=502049 RepID=A0A367WPZ6_9PROT|nr:MFS transporter [Thalassospira profundimaris]RCK43467.1 major facilitator transporter [Thalassospira profundimaris]